MTLCGILKNILLVIASVMIWHTSISSLQFIGYGIALGGLVYYSVGWDQMVGVTLGIWSYARNMWDSKAEESRLPPALRRALFMTLAMIIVVVLVAGVLYGSGAGLDAAAAIKDQIVGGVSP